MTDLEVIRAHVMEADENGLGIRREVVISLLDALEAVEPELLLLRSLAADVDALFDGAEGDLFQKGHANCLCTRRVADFKRTFWAPNAEARGFVRQRGKTWGRGRG